MTGPASRLTHHARSQPRAAACCRQPDPASMYQRVRLDHTHRHIDEPVARFGPRSADPGHRRDRPCAQQAPTMKTTQYPVIVWIHGEVNR